MTIPTSSELPSFETVFAPVRSQTAFEETLERLGPPSNLGPLAPGGRLAAEGGPCPRLGGVPARPPPARPAPGRRLRRERELCGRREISRRPRRRALPARAQPAPLREGGGRGGGPFGAERPPPLDPPSRAVLASWRGACDVRLGIELGIASL